MAWPRNARLFNLFQQRMMPQEMARRVLACCPKEVPREHLSTSIPSACTFHWCWYPPVYCGVGLAATKKEKTQIAQADYCLSQATKLQIAQGNNLYIGFYLAVICRSSSSANLEPCCFPCQCVPVATYTFMFHLNPHRFIIDPLAHSLPFHTQTAHWSSLSMKAWFQFNQITSQLSIKSSSMNCSCVQNLR